MSRIHDDWLEAYMRYTEDTESAEKFHRWAGLSAIAGALGRKVKFKAGRLVTWPNMYIILAGASGARKGQAANYAAEIVDNCKLIKQSPNNITPKELAKVMEKSRQKTTLPDGEFFFHSSVSAYINEFGGFVGNKKESKDILMFLTDVYDYPRRKWEYGTKVSGYTTILEPSLNFLAAATTESLADCLPASSVGTGFTARVIYVVSMDKARDVAIPTETDEIKKLKSTLVIDLQEMSKLSGTYTFDEETTAKYTDWYNNLKNVSRICNDPTFDSWYQRKHIFVIKTAMLLTAARGKEAIEWPQFSDALDYVEETEKFMPYALAGLGRSQTVAETASVINFMRQRGSANERALQLAMMRDMDYKKLKTILETLLISGKIEETVRATVPSPTNTYYSWCGDDDD